jgi:glycosyltransferase involved in cell wall biosynthesis
MLNVQEKAGNYDKAKPPPPQNPHFTRKKVSVVFSYRNREYMRVKRCLDSLANQSFSDFEAVFVDYGSSASFRNEVRPLVESYPFARYHYAWTEDYAWNRSHALNIGIRLSDSEYILLADIDLIYSPDALRGLVAEAGKDTAVYSSMFYLERSFAGWEDLPRPEASVLRDSGDDPIGAVYLVHKDILEHIRGFDEYYAFWGVEDRDLHHRIQMLGISSTRIDKTRYPIYHQWHPIVSDRTRDFFPEKWWDDMNIHYALNENVIRRNGAGW